LAAQWKPVSTIAFLLHASVVVVRSFGRLHSKLEHKDFYP
jgi:hypothetical protein